MVCGRTVQMESCRVLPWPRARASSLAAAATLACSPRWRTPPTAPSEPAAPTLSLARVLGKAPRPPGALRSRSSLFQFSPPETDQSALIAFHVVSAVAYDC